MTLPDLSPEGVEKILSRLRGEAQWADANGSKTTLANVEDAACFIEALVELNQRLQEMYDATTNGWLDTEATNQRLRRVLFMCAGHCQGGHSDGDREVAEVLGAPFPLTMPGLIAKAKAEGLSPSELWPWNQRANPKGWTAAARQSLTPGEQTP